MHSRIRFFGIRKTYKPIKPPINLIWIGSILREKDLKVLKNWKKLNPDRPVKVWVETKFKAEIEKQLKGEEIEVVDIVSLDMPAVTKAAIFKLTDKADTKFPFNPAAATDLIRFYILDKGGSYFDLDIKPFNLDDMKIDSEYRIIVPKLRHGSMLPPHSMISESSSLLTKNAIACIEALASNELMKQENINLLRSNIASVRAYATMCTTGYILSVAVSSLFSAGRPIFDRNKHEYLNQTAMNAISRIFAGTSENSWIRIPGVELDKYYYEKKLVTSKKEFHIFHNSCLKTFNSVIEARADTLHTPLSLMVFKNEIKQTTPLSNEKVLDCITDYMWTSKSLY